MSGFQFGQNILTNPNIMGGGQAFANSVSSVANTAGNATAGISQAGGAVSKLSKGLDVASKAAAPIQAATSVIGLGMDIYNTIQAQKQAKEQMDLAKKNFNLELEKQQKQELANNQLAASIDKAWGGSGKVESTIDYSQYKLGEMQNNLGGNSLVAGGAGAGQVMGENSNTKPSTDNADLGGSGNMPTMSSAGATSPVGYSESVGNENEGEGEKESA